jgi:hypothetical protein
MVHPLNRSALRLDDILANGSESGGDAILRWRPDLPILLRALPAHRHQMRLTRSE